MKIILEYRSAARAAEAMDQDFDEFWPRRTRNKNMVTFTIDDARASARVIDHVVFDLASATVDRNLKNCVILP